jgi:hypothetical protein
MRLPLKRFPFQTIIIPPEFPTEGVYAYWFRFLGQKFLKYA